MTTKVNLSGIHELQLDLPGTTTADIAYPGSTSIKNSGFNGVNKQTGTSYTIQSTDNQKLVTLNNVSPVALTLPQPGTAQIDSNFAVWITNEGAGTVTITPNVSTIDGHANLDLHTNQGVIVFTDGTDYFAVRGIGGGSGGNALFSHYTDAGTSGTTETDLYSDTIAGNTLSTDGSSVFARYAGTLANSTSTKQLKVYFAGRVVFDSGALNTTSAADWNIDVMIIRESATVARCTVAANLTGASAQEFANYTRIASINLTADQVLKITGTAAGTGAASNDISATEGLGWFPGGSVTSVGLSVPPRQTVSGSPVTTEGTLSVTDNPQNANTFFRGPNSGPAATPTFGPLVSADLPIATSTAVGAVKPDGSTITVAADGTISSTGGSGLSFLAPITKPTLSTLNMPLALNQTGTFVASNQSNGVCLIDTLATGSEHLEGIMQTYPSVPFTATAMIMPTPRGANFTLAGFAAAASLTGKLQFFGGRWSNGAWTISQLQYTSPTAYGGATVVTSGTLSSFGWLRYSDDGTNITMSASADGILWSTVYTVAKSSSWLGASGYGYFGLIIDPTGSPVGMSVLSYVMSAP